MREQRDCSGLENAGLKPELPNEPKGFGNTIPTTRLWEFSQ